MNPTKRLAALLVAICLLLTLLPGAVFSAEPMACHPSHTEECGFVAAAEEQPCAHRCDQCAPEGVPPDSAPAPQCSCAAACTVDAVPATCPLCGGDRADLTLCAGPVPPAALRAAPRAGTMTALDVSKGDIVIKSDGVTGKDSSGTPVTAHSPDGYSITGTTTQYTIRVESGAHTLLLDGVNVEAGNNSTVACAFEVKTGATVTLQLSGTNTLKSGMDCAGIRVPSGATLNIEEKTVGGAPTVLTSVRDNGSGIGGDNDSGPCGTVEIRSGAVTATGNGGAAGIGGGVGSDGGTILIRGGTVEAVSTFSSTGTGAGIGGGGDGGDGGDGGGGDFQHGKGGNGGNGGSGGTIFISGATVTASSIGGGYGGYGIIGGNGGDGANLTIGDNALVIASPIGGGLCGSGLDSDGSNGGAGTKTFINCVVIEGKRVVGSNELLYTGAVYGTPTLGTDAELPAGSTLTIAAGQTLTIAPGVTFTNKGTIQRWLPRASLTGTVTNEGSGVIALIGTEITTDATLPSGTAGTAYSQTLAAEGDAPITWTVIAGALPQGLTLSATGTLTGTPAAAGTTRFTVQATSTTNTAAHPGDTKELALTIAGSTAVTPPPSTGDERETRPDGVETGRAKSEISKAPVGGKVTIPMNGDTTLSKDVLDAAKGKNINLVFDFGGYTWTVNDRSIGDVPAGGVDLETKRIQIAHLFDRSGKAGVGQLEIAYSGALPFDGVLDYNIGAAFNDKTLHLYYYDEGADALAYRSSAKVAAGRVKLVFDHASRYVLTLERIDTPENPFTDVGERDWFYADVQAVYQTGLLTGTTGTTFTPDGTMTRGMFVTALGRLAGVDTDKYKNSPFTDVPANAYYAPYVAWAAETGITSGTSATTFAPDKAITRQELAVLMQRYAKVMGYPLPRSSAESIFADSASISDLAKDAVKAMQLAGVMNGKDGNRFDPTSTATRAEVAAVLRRYVALVIAPATA